MSAVVAERGRQIQEVNTVFEIVADNPDFDTNAYLRLKSIEFTNPLLYQQRLRELNEYTKENKVKSIGERLRVNRFVSTYEIRDGELYGENTTDSLLTMTKRGRDFMREKNEFPVDFDREDAEVESFEKVQNYFANPTTPVGSMVLLVSPPGKEGSKYQERFHDIAVKTGEATVEYKRYVSPLGVDEYRSKIRKIDPTYEVPFEDSDIHLLKNPVIVDTKKLGINSSDALHNFLQEGKGDAATLSATDFEHFVVPYIDPYIQIYIRGLEKDPYNIELRNMTFNTIVHMAEKAAKSVKSKRQGKIYEKEVYQRASLHDVMKNVYFYGGQQLARRDVACGNSKGMTVGSGQEPSGPSTQGPFRVTEYGGSRLLCCTCPFCKQQVEAKISAGKISCPECGKSADWRD